MVTESDHIHQNRRLHIPTAIALLDSVHFRQTGAASGGELLSAFDLLVTPLRTRVERTYSAPLAAEAYTREMVELCAM